MHHPLSPILFVLLMASPGSPAQAESPAGSLPAWDQLSASQREALVAPVRARWEASPGDRPRMLERARRWQAMTPDERARAGKGMRKWEGMSPEMQRQMRALHGRLRTLPESERKTLRARWQAMTPAQRSAWVEANPPPPKDPERDVRDPR